MLAILSAVFGFISPFVPEVLKLAKGWQEHRFELQRLRLSAELAEKQHAWRMEALNVEADIQEAALLHQPQPSFGVQILDRARADMHPALWVPVFWAFALLDWISGMVRPTVAFLVVGAYVLYKWARFELMQRVSDASFAWHDAVVRLYDEQDYAMLAYVLMFYFGQRAAKAAFGGNASHGGGGR